jgi:hypothetical protein
VAQLEQSAGVLVARHVAAHQLQRDRPLYGQLAARLREGARDRVLTEVEYRGEL